MPSSEETGIEMAMGYEEKIYAAVDRGLWRDVLDILRQERDHSLLIWPTPTEETLRFIQGQVTGCGQSGVVSIGSGSGLLEWLLSTATGLPVRCVEVNREWWTSKYCKRPFMPLEFADEHREETAGITAGLPTPPRNNENSDEPPQFCPSIGRSGLATTSSADEARTLNSVVETNGEPELDENGRFPPPATRREEEFQACRTAANGDGARVDAEGARILAAALKTAAMAGTAANPDGESEEFPNSATHVDGHSAGVGQNDFPDASPAPTCENSALLFCYFNNREAFRSYLDSYRGPSVILVGPGPESRGRHCDPEPFDLKDDPGWKLTGFSEMPMGDVVASYERR